MTTTFDEYVNTFLEMTQIAPNPARMRYTDILAYFTPNDLKEAREWITDCEWDDIDADEVPHLTDVEIVKGICKNYEGGWREFLRSNHPH